MGHAARAALYTPFIARLPVRSLTHALQNPTFQVIYPGPSTITITRNLNDSFTPIPNTTAFGPSGSVYAQLFYLGVEQFYCTADTCEQDLGNDDGSSNWSCQNLECTCRTGTNFCGAVRATDLSGIINQLSGTLGISCGPTAPENNTASCSFNQDIIDQVFGSAGISLSGCVFGECIAQSTLNTLSGNSTIDGTDGGGSSLSGGVIAGLAVVGSLIGLALFLLLLGLVGQRRARKQGVGALDRSGGVAIAWSDVSYLVPQQAGPAWLRRRAKDVVTEKTVLDNVSGRVVPGEIMAILGPSGAGKTTLIEILAQKHKVGRVTGGVSFPGTGSRKPRVGFVPQQDVLPPMLTVREALLFAARLRLPEGVPDVEKQARVDDIMTRLGIAHVSDVRIGDGEKRGISGGEMRRVTIGLELVSKPDVLLLDEPTSGLDSVSAKKVANVLHALAHDPKNPTAVIASIHQPRYVTVFSTCWYSTDMRCPQLSLVSLIRPDLGTRAWSRALLWGRWFRSGGALLCPGYRIQGRLQRRGLPPGDRKRASCRGVRPVRQLQDRAAR